MPDLIFLKLCLKAVSYNRIGQEGRKKDGLFLKTGMKSFLFSGIRNRDR